jgi:hypothetical protein
MTETFPRIPQGLKPASFLRLSGTAEAVPWYEAIYEMGLSGPMLTIFVIARFFQLQNHVPF